MSKTGKSYLGFPCVKCGHPVLLFDIPANKPTPDIGLGGVTRVLRCAHCMHYAQYHTKGLQRYEGDETGGKELHTQ